MEDGSIGAAVADRAGGNPWVSTLDALSIVPHVPEERREDFPGSPASPCLELGCISERFSGSILAAAELRAGQLGIGADRVLVASGLIAEEDYAQALAAACGVMFEPLTNVPRAACPFTDERLIEAAAVGMLPLLVDGGLVVVVAPRGTAARRLAGLFSSGNDLARCFRFTSSQRLQQFVVKHDNKWLAQHAAEGLRLSHPDLSAAPRPRGSAWLKSFSLAGCALAAAALAPVQAYSTLEVLLAMVFIAWIVLRLFGSLVKHPEPRRFPRVSEDRLPIYTIIAALYREAASVEQLIACLRQIDYPPEKLDIKLVIEPDDTETRDAIERLHLGSPFEVIVAPNAGPRTKPKALNAALPFARGALTVIYDAEDRPEPDQLRRALNMFLAEADLACVQARLTIDNTADSWLARFFTAEYAGQFDVFLPGLAALEMPLPLGGSSNHFRTAVLRKLGAWDPYNVTEDADLGMRLSRFSHRTTVIASTTYEEAPAHFMPWLRQRTRWFKGWMKTWLVHMRSPRRLLADLGFGGFMTFQLVVGGNVLAALVYPVFLTGAIWEFTMQGPAGEGWANALLAGLHGTALVMGFAVAAFVAWLGLARRGLAGTAWVLVLIPLHWLLLSLAAWRALYQLLRDPYRWEKTEHGLARTSRLAREKRLTPVFPKRPRRDQPRDIAAALQPTLPAAV